MKVAVVGSRTFTDYKFLEKKLKKIEIDTLISGGAIGADTYAQMYAEKNNIKIQIFKPDWKRYGRSAGMIRNKLIVNTCDFLIAFWDGKSKGTKNSIDLAKKQKKKVLIYNANI